MYCLGTKVRIKQSAYDELIEIGSEMEPPTGMLNTVLTVSKIGRDRAEGRRYRVACDKGYGWWVPGSLIRSICMFDKEV